MTRRRRTRRGTRRGNPGWSTLAKVAAGVAAYTTGAYVVDVIVRPHLVAQEAVAFARAAGKPIINVGAGTPGSSLRVALLGPTLWGDVNVDIAADRSIQPGPGVVSFGDAHQLPYPDKHFGALIASHVLEHMDDPAAALREFQRVADRVFIITPRWWAPHTWLHPGHQWTIDDRALMAQPGFDLRGVRPLHRHGQNQRLLTGRG